MELSGPCSTHGDLYRFDLIFEEFLFQTPLVCLRSRLPLQIPNNHLHIYTHKHRSGRSSDIQKVSCRKIPDDTLVIFFMKLGDRIWFFIIASKLSKNLIPRNPDTDCDPQFLFYTASNLICNLFFIPF